MENNIKQLIQNLKSLDADLKISSIDELRKLVEEHAETALRWAMNNDLDNQRVF